MAEIDSEKLKESLEKMAKTMDEAVGKAKSTIQKLGKSIHSVVMTTKDAFKELEAGAMEMIDKINSHELGKAFEKEFVDTWRTIEDFLENMCRINPDTLLTGWEELGAELAGTVERIFESIDFSRIGTMLADGVNYAFQGLKNFTASVPWEAMAISIYTGLNNMIQGINWEEAGKILSAFVMKLLGVFQEVAQKTDWEGLARGIGEFLSNIDWMGILGTVWNVLWEVFSGCIDGLFETLAGKIILGMAVITGEDGLFSKLLGGAIELVSNLGPILNSIASVIFSPTGSLILGIAAGVLLIIANWDKIKEAAEIIWGGITEFLQTTWNSISETAAAVWGGITEFLQTTWNVISETAAAVWGGITEFFGGIWNGIKETVETVWSGITEFLQTTWNSISETAAAVWGGITDFFGRIWNGMKEAAEAVWNGISNFLQGTWEGIRNRAEAIWNGISGFLEGVWNGIKGTAESIWNAVAGFCREVWEGVKSVAEETWNSVSAFLKETWSGIKGAAEEIWGGIKTFFSDTWEGLKAKAKEAGDSIGRFFSDTWDGIKTRARDAWDSVTETIGNFAANTYEKVKDVPEKIYGAVKNTAGKMQDAGKSLIGGVIEGISSTAGRAYDAISGVAGNLVSSFKNRLGIHSPSRAFMQLADYMIQGLVKGADNEENSILDKMSELAQNMTRPFDGTFRLHLVEDGGYAVPAWEVNDIMRDGMPGRQGGFFGELGSEYFSINGQYMMEGIEEAAYRGFLRASAENTREEDLLERLIEAVKEGKSITIDGREIVTTYDKWKNRIGWGF